MILQGFILKYKESLINMLHNYVQSNKRHISVSSVEDEDGLVVTVNIKRTLNPDSKSWAETIKTLKRFGEVKSKS